MIKRISAAASFLAIVVFISGCVSLTPKEQRQWQYLRDNGIVSGPTTYKDSSTAMMYNILPGLAELAYFELDNYTPGALLMISNLVWPWSILWGMPAAIQNTEPANIKLTIKAHMEDLPEDMRTAVRRKPPKKPGSAKPAPGLTEEEQPVVPPGQRPKVAVFNFEDLTSGSGKDFGKIVAEFFHSALFHTERFRVIERERITKVLQEQNFAASDMVDQSKAIEIGKLLKVEYILIGAIAKMGSEYTINARMVKVETGETAAASPTGKTNREEEIDTVVTDLAQYLGAHFR